MKVFAILAAAAFAVASAQTACDTTKLIPAVTTPGGNGAKCTAETTYSPALLKVPTGEVLAKVCASTACQELLAEVTKIATPDCTFSGKSVTETILGPITKACGALKEGGAAAGNSTTPAANSTTPETTAPAATTAAPAATTVAPAAEESSASGAGEETVAEVTTAPAANATTPAPAKASSAASVATAAGAVVVAVAASLF